MTSSTSPFNTLNVQTYIQALTQSENLQIAKIQAQQQVNLGMSTLTSKMQTLLTNLQTSVTQLQSAFSVSPLTVNTSNTSNLTAQIMNPDVVAPMSHTINVQNLATSQQLMSSGSGVFTTQTTGLGLTGTLQFTNTQTSANFTIAMAPGDSLQNIRDNINNSSANFGVTASIYTQTTSSGTQYQLVLTSTQTGSAGAFSVSDSTGQFGFNQTQAAANAQYTIDSNPTVLTSSSNTVSNVFDGINFTMLTANTSTVLTVSSNTQALTSSVQTGITNFINAYNAILNFAEGSIADNGTGPAYTGQSLSSANPSAIQGGVGDDALGDSTFSQIISILQNAMNTPYTGAGAFSQLSQVGVTLVANSQYTPGVPPTPEPSTLSKHGVVYYQTGQMQANSTTLSQVLGSNFTDIQSLFTNGSTGVLTTMTTALNNIINGTMSGSTISPGILTNENNMIAASNTNLTTQQNNAQQSLQQATAKITQQVSTVNALLAQLNFVNQMLTAEFTPSTSS